MRLSHYDFIKPSTVDVLVGLAEALSQRNDCDVSKMKCIPCNSTFANAKTLNFHMMNKHSKERKLYPCIYCKNVFTQVSVHY